jgi:hypothetical protein
MQESEGVFPYENTIEMCVFPYEASSGRRKYQQEAISYQLSASSYQLSAISYQLTASGRFSRRPEHPEGSELIADS